MKDIGKRQYRGPNRTKNEMHFKSPNDRLLSTIASVLFSVDAVLIACEFGYVYHIYHAELLQVSKDRQIQSEQRARELFGDDYKEDMESHKTLERRSYEAVCALHALAASLTFVFDILSAMAMSGRIAWVNKNLAGWFIVSAALILSTGTHLFGVGAFFSAVTQPLGVHANHMGGKEHLLGYMVYPYVCIQNFSQWYLGLRFSKYLVALSRNMTMMPDTLPNESPSKLFENTSCPTQRIETDSKAPKTLPTTIK